MVELNSKDGGLFGWEVVSGIGSQALPILPRIWGILGYTEAYKALKPALDGVKKAPSGGGSSVASVARYLLPTIDSGYKSLMNTMGKTITPGMVNTVVSPLLNPQVQGLLETFGEMIDPWVVLMDRMSGYIFGKNEEPYWWQENTLARDLDRLLALLPGALGMIGGTKYLRDLDVLTPVTRPLAESNLMKGVGVILGNQGIMDTVNLLLKTTVQLGGMLFGGNLPSLPKLPGVSGIVKSLGKVSGGD